MDHAIAEGEVPSRARTCHLTRGGVSKEFLFKTPKETCSHSPSKPSQGDRNEEIRTMP